MPISQDHHDLFRSSDISDKLDLLQSLLDSKDLTSDKALALLNIIRGEFEQPQRHNSSVYRRYSQVMEFLHKQMPEVYEQVVNAWQQRRPVAPSTKPTIQSLISEPMKAASETTRTIEAEAGLEEPREDIEEPAKGGHETISRAEPQEALKEEIGETEEEHEESEEEHEEESEKEETEKEEEIEEESEKETEKEEEKENDNDKEEESEEENHEEEEKNEEELAEKEEGKSEELEEERARGEEQEENTEAEETED